MSHTFNIFTVSFSFVCRRKNNSCFSKDANCRKTLACGAFSFSFTWMHLKTKSFVFFSICSCCLYNKSSHRGRKSPCSVFGRHRCTGISASLLLLYREASEHATSCRESAPHTQVNVSGCLPHPRTIITNCNRQHASLHSLMFK